MNTFIKYLFFTGNIFLFYSNLTSAQTSEENWVPVKFSETKKIYINSTGLENFTGDDIYVWVLQENDPPVEIDGIEGDVYKTKSYYLINRKLMRYSILDIIFYGGKNEVLKNYSYDRNTDDESFKYNYPMFGDSDEEQILVKCLEISGNQQK